MKKTIAVVACLGATAALGLSGCSQAQTASGSGAAASAEQLAQHTPNSWTEPVQESTTRSQSDVPLKDGVYTGSAPGMSGMVGVKLLVQDNHITCLETTQDGETQSVGGYEAIRDGVYAQMIDQAQGADIDTISGATVTTTAVKNAVSDALSQAQEGQQASSGQATDGEGR